VRAPLWCHTPSQIGSRWAHPRTRRRRGRRRIRSLGEVPICVGRADRGSCSSTHRVDRSRYRRRSIVDLIDDVHACDQGGIDDPSTSQSWECPGCRKDYDPGEYATAVRRDLLARGPDQDGWTHIAMAAEAVTVLAGVTFGPARIRRWMDRGQVASMCRWKSGTAAGARLAIHPARVANFVEKWAAGARREARDPSVRHAN
jgi:hypothetical protein